MPSAITTPFSSMIGSAKSVSGSIPFKLQLSESVIVNSSPGCISVGALKDMLQPKSSPSTDFNFPLSSVS
ncbi:MAG: hypothetical protein E7C89_08750 [Anaerococcus sp.]|nr:hypothetical protein [Anaerococcus sp.]MDU2566653.1 hypothetical protein [Anaerococcus sp.]